MSTVSSRSKCAELKVPGKGWVLPERLWPQMRVLWGDILTEAEMMEAVQGCDMVISVGDVVSLALIQNGKVPHVTIYDRSTERKPMTSLDRYMEAIEGHCIVLENPPGSITPALVEAVKEAIEGEGPYKILVKGEEDLAALVCAAVAPERSCLVYGVPKKGITLVRVDRNVRENALKLINDMEESN